MLLDYAYKAALVVLILVSMWAVLSKKIHDKAVLITGLAFVCFASIAMLTQSLTNFYASVNATKIFVIGASIFATRCFYIKFIAIKFKRFIRSKKVND